MKDKADNAMPTNASDRFEGLTGKRFWRSLDEWSETEEFREIINRHFPSRAEEIIDPVNRRTFMKVMGASLAFAGLSGCSPVQPTEMIYPYTTQPDDVVASRPLFFATAMPFAGYGMGVLVQSNMGRPTKVEGNRLHPASLGAADAAAQASVLTVYDPDRSPTVQYGGRTSSWDAFLGAVGELRNLHRTDGGARLRILTDTVTSPTVGAQMQSLLSANHFPNAQWYQYSPVNTDSAREASRQALGGDFEAIYNFENADVVLSLDSNFLVEGPGRLVYARQFMGRHRLRDEGAQQNRLYAVESFPTLTGAAADNRLLVRPSQVDALARAIAQGVGVAGGGSPTSEHAEFVAAVVKDLQAHRGRSLVIAGDYQPPVVHAIAHAINQSLGNVGTTVTFRPSAEVAPAVQATALNQLAQEIAAGQVDTLVVLGANPVYTAPADLDFENLFQSVRLRIHLGEYHDETGFLSHWHIPQAHYLESWGDIKAYDGTVTIQQPLIAPLYQGKTNTEVLAAFLGQGGRTAYEIVRTHWMSQMPGATPASIPENAPAAVAAPVPPGFEDFWRKALNDGIVTLPQAAGRGAAAAPAPAPTSGSAQANQGPGAAPASTPADAAAQPATPPAQAQAETPAPVPATTSPAPEAAPRPAVNVNPALLAQPVTPVPDGVEVLFRPDPTIYDGRYANNGWLQELPKPLVKLTWDNAALMSIRLADRLGVQNEDVVSLTLDGRSVEAPVRIMPGHPDNCVTVFLGYGRTRAGRVGTGTGFNAYKLRTTRALWSGGGLTVTPTGGRWPLAITEHHNLITASATAPKAGSLADHYSEGNQRLEGGPGRVDGDHGRDIFRAVSAAKFTEDPMYFQHHGPPPGEAAGDHGAGGHAAPLGDHGVAGDHGAAGDHGNGHKEPPTLLKQDWSYETGYKWGMVIDTQACTGCSACVVACQAENNSPVVGKEQVIVNREMHWLRVDNYYEGPVESPRTYFQPIPCQQCENAPCELVCPVSATVHSAEGLNDMVYNRCVGTRYCSNNCPYKVRRFNFLLYADQSPLAQLGKNPNVTVRTRGVMEKCTYCVQRIWHARIESQIESREIRDGEVATACQQTCPTEAIIFGNLNDPNSRVSKYRASKLNYSILDHHLNTKPRTTYLGRVVNTNPEIEPDIEA